MRRGIKRNEASPRPRQTRKAFGKRFWTGRALAVAVLGALVARPAPAQSPASAPIADAPGLPAPAPACAGCGPALGDDLCGCEGGGHFPCVFYARGGIASPMGVDPIASRMDTGWTAQVGLEQKISCPSPWLDIFVDGGFGYLEAQGKGDQIPVVTPGTLIAPVAPLNTTPFNSNDFFFTRLGRFRRSDFHAALDGHFYLPSLNRSGQRQVTLDLRGGLRVSAVGISYGQTPTPTLQAEINTLISPSATGAPGLDPRQFLFLSQAEKHDYAFGQFVSIGASWTRNDLRYGWFSLGTVRAGVEVEFSHDSINAGAFTGGKRSLWTVAPLATFGLSF